MALDVNSIIAGFDPSKYGYARNADGSKPNGWYLNGAESPSNPFGGGGAFEDYLNQNGIRMWDPGNPSWGRVGYTNKQAFDYLNPGAEILGTGSDFSNADAGLAGTQFITGGGAPLGSALAGLDYGDHSSWQNNFLDKAWTIPVGLATGPALGTFGFGSGTNIFDSIFSGGLDVPYDVGQNLVNNPDVFGNSGIDPSWGVNLRTGMDIPDIAEENLLDPSRFLEQDLPFDPSGNLLNNPDVFNSKNLLDLVAKYGSGVLKYFSGGGGSKGSKPTTGIDWLDNILDGVSGVAGAVSPLIAANYAKNTLGGLDPLNDQIIADANKFNPEAATLNYDLQTGQGRNALTASLADRGVSGSSFGNFDMNSFNTLRDVGRQNVLNGGVTTQANLLNTAYQNKLAQKKAELGFLGAGLYGSGNALKSNQLINGYTG